MKQLILDQWARLYEETDRRPDARLFSRGDLIRFAERDGSIPAGAVLRVETIDGPNNRLELRRRNGEVVPWSPTSAVQAFAVSQGEVKAGMVFEWKADQAEIGAQ